MADLIDRQAAIDSLNVGAELLRRVLDDTYIVGAEREKYVWGLGLIESCISDMEELPSAQPEIIRCKDCKHYDEEHEVCCVYLSYRLAKNEDDFCSDAERKDNAVKP